VGIPVAVISAIYELPMTTGANRVIKGARIEHVCGDPSLGEQKDFEYGVRITRTALKALETAVDRPTLFDPADMMPAVRGVVHAS
jgi:hypothetical protein